MVGILATIQGSLAEAQDMSEPDGLTMAID